MIEVTALKPGTYVIAVSGGVDSMVLLDLLARQPQARLVVAHFEHGIRADSDEDRKLVEAAAAHYGLPFIYERGHLGERASEATARAARYDFLQQVRAEQGAEAIITAHHQDDVLETAILNVLRGTGRKGLSSLGSHDTLVRPLLQVPKSAILAHAKQAHLAWRDESTNADDRYLRNYIRHHILPRFQPNAQAALLGYIQEAHTLNRQIDTLLAEDLAKQPGKDELRRSWFIALPHSVAAETMAAWLRQNGIADFDRARIERLVVAAKTARPGKKADVNADHQLENTKESIRLVRRST